jgi:hypothetical protein
MKRGHEKQFDFTLSLKEIMLQLIKTYRMHGSFLNKKNLQLSEYTGLNYYEQAIVPAYLMGHQNQSATEYTATINKQFPPPPICNTDKIKSGGGNTDQRDQ